MNTTTYQYETLRDFYIRRTFLIDSPRDRRLLTTEEYQQLKARRLHLSPSRKLWLDGFVAGWTRRE